MSPTNKRRDLDSWKNQYEKSTEKVNICESFCDKEKRRETII